MNDFPEKLKRLRGTSGQIAAAKRAGISQQMWSKLEAGKQSPEKSAAVIHIARKFDVTVESLLQDGPLVYTSQNNAENRPESIGDRIARLTKERGHNEAWLRKATGMPQEAIRRMIDESMVEAAVLVKLVLALEVSADELLLGELHKQSPPLKTESDVSQEGADVETATKSAKDGRHIYGPRDAPELRFYKKSKKT